MLTSDLHMHVYLHMNKYTHKKENTQNEQRTVHVGETAKEARVVEEDTEGDEGKALGAPWATSGHWSCLLSR